MNQEKMSGWEKKMNGVWNQPLMISEESEEKIQDAYAKVLQQCRQKAAKSKVRPMERRRSVRRLAVASMAAVMLVGTGLVAAAAMGYFTRSVNRENEDVSYAFQLNYELQPVEVQAEPGYLPEGLTRGDDGKYWDSQEEGRGITITPVNMLNVETAGKQMNFRFVDQVEHTTIQDMEADVLTSKDAQKYQRGSSILLFNPSEGYVIWLWGDYGVPVEELKQVAEKLNITVSDNPDLSYDSEEALAMKEKGEADYDTDYAQFIEAGIQAETVTPLGEYRDCAHHGVRFQVEEVQVFDSLYEVPGYTEQGLYNKADVTPWLNADGTHKPYERACYDSQSGQVLREETVHAKFMAVKIQASKYVGEDSEEVPLDACLVSMTKPGADGAYHWLDTYYDAVPSENYELQMDNRSFYLSDPQNLEGDARWHSFFWRTMNVGDELSYTMVFAVDEDVLADENTELLLDFDASAGDQYQTDYWRLEK